MRCPLRPSLANRPFERANAARDKSSNAGLGGLKLLFSRARNNVNRIALQIAAI
jgi:hypothetical protein